MLWVSQDGEDVLTLCLCNLACVRHNVHFASVKHLRGQVDMIAATELFLKFSSLMVFFPPETSFLAWHTSKLQRVLLLQAEERDSVLDLVPQPL